MPVSARTPSSTAHQMTLHSLYAFPCLGKTYKPEIRWALRILLHPTDNKIGGRVAHVK